MTERALQYRRVHNLLLIQKHLTLREGSSPLTLILDSVEQSAKPLIRRYIHNAKISEVDTIFISYETLTPPAGVTHFIKAWRREPSAVQRDIAALTSPSQRNLLIIDTLYPLATTATPTFSLPTFLSALLSSPSTTLLAIYHTDIPLPLPSPSQHYTPPPLTLLRYLATTIFTLHSLPQVLAKKRAAEKSLPEPVFGIAEEREGVIVGLVDNAAGTGTGLVLEMEFRRKSGRGVEETFFLPASPEGKVVLLDDYPEFNRRDDDDDAAAGGAEIEGGEFGGVEQGTFDLNLTAKQRRDREGVVLPYFDAQDRMGEAGRGGRILYDLGVEDDFDEEEDEI